MNALLRKREALLKRMEGCSEVLRGSVTSVCSTCNRAACICDQPSHRKAYRLTYKDSQGRSRTLYVAREQLPAVRRMVKNYGKMRKLTEQLLETNIAIFKQLPKR
jgi:hypothetical protein